MTTTTFIEEAIKQNTIYLLINKDDEFAQLESEQTEQQDWTPCMIQFLFSNESSCTKLTNLLFTDYHPIALPISEVLEYLLAVDEAWWLVMLNPTAEMNQTEHEPVDIYNAIGEKLWLFEEE